MATPAELLAQTLDALRNANRIDGTKASYRKDNPNEYAAVIAYLDGGARPSGTLTLMGQGLVGIEDARLALEPPPPPPPPPPTEFPAVGISAWPYSGDWALGADVDRQFDDYANLHATWVRHEFAWDVIEPQKGQFRWEGCDKVVASAKARGINVLALITYTPPWANGGNGNHAFKPASPAEFGRFCGDVARRYSSQGVHAYEIWNEWNIPQFWQPTPDPAAYTPVLKAAHDAIKQADPAATVVTGGLSPEADTKTIGFLKGIYANGGKGYFDAVGYHPYTDSDDFTATADGYIWSAMGTRSGEDMRDVMSANGDAGKRIWATEVGCKRTDYSCPARIWWAFERWHSYSWAGPLFWFTYWDTGAYGLVNGDWSWRQVAHAYKDAAAVAS